LAGSHTPAWRVGSTSSNSYTGYPDSLRKWGCGNTGVYTLPEGSRVEAAIEAAGGLVQGAEAENINLAVVLLDGQQVNVPGIVETGHVNIGRVNINTASAAELDALPGIGPTTAQAIVDYRLQNGPFQVIQDIQNVPGVGPATFALIQDYINVGP